jgi:hypothetical protein
MVKLLRPSVKHSLTIMDYALSSHLSLAPVPRFQGRSFWESERGVYSHLSPFLDVNWRWVMSAVASAKTNLVEPSAPLASPYGLGMPTGYRVVVVPGALEITARLVEPNEVRNLMKVLRAGCIILEETTWTSH